MDDFVNPVIAKTEKILQRLNVIDDKFLSLEDELIELKWELDDIKNSISPLPSKVSSEQEQPIVKPKQIQSKTIVCGAGHSMSKK